MTGDPIFLVGVFVLLAGVAGGGLKLAGNEIGKLGQAASAVFFLAGIGLLFLAWDGHRFRVTEVELRAVNSYVGPCPGDQIMEGRITTKGGDGTVTYRVFSDGGYRSPQLSEEVESSGTFGFELRVPVDRPQGGASSARDVMHARINSPNSKDSGPVPFEIICR